MKLDLTKPMQTRDGRKVRFLGTMNDVDYPLVFAVTFFDSFESKERESAETYTLEGRIYKDSVRVYDDEDIINVPEEITRYVILKKTKDSWLIHCSYNNYENAKYALETFEKSGEYRLKTVTFDMSKDDEE